MVMVQKPKLSIKSLSTNEPRYLLYLIRSTKALSSAFKASSTTSLLRRLELENLYQAFAIGTGLQKIVLNPFWKIECWLLGLETSSLPG